MTRLSGKSGPSRRRFVAGSVIVAALSSVSPIVLVRTARAADWQAFTPHEGATLVKLVRDLFPHDFLPDTAYEAALAGLDAQAASDDKTREMLKAGIADLDARAQGAAGKDFADIADESKRLAVLKAMEEGELFQTVYGSTQLALYNESAIWPKFGFEAAE